MLSESVFIVLVLSPVALAIATLVVLFRRLCLDRLECLPPGSQHQTLPAVLSRDSFKIAVSKTTRRSGLYFCEPTSEAAADKSVSHFGFHVHRILNLISSKGLSYVVSETCAYVMLVVFLALLVFLSLMWAHKSIVTAQLTATSFLFGCIASGACSIVSYVCSLFSTTAVCMKAHALSLKEAFFSAFRSSQIAGLLAHTVSLFLLFSLLLFWRENEFYKLPTNLGALAVGISGYSLGASTIALFLRIGGGVVSKSTDMAANIIGLTHKFSESDARNPASIARFAGVVLSNVSALGSDLSGSFLESLSASLILSALNLELCDAGLAAVCFPISIASTGLLVSLLVQLCVSIGTKIEHEADLAYVFRMQLLLSALAISLLAYPVALLSLPSSFVVVDVSHTQVTSPFAAASCVGLGACCSFLYALFVEFYTSPEFAPVQKLASFAKRGAVFEILEGLSLGHKSVLPFVSLLAAEIFVCFHLAGLYGVSLAAVGMMATMATTSTNGACAAPMDNSLGVAIMSCAASKRCLEHTEDLNAAGNAAAMQAKGLGIMSSSLVALGLLAALASRFMVLSRQVLVAEGGYTLLDVELVGRLDVLEPLTIVFVLIGMCIPHYFASLSIRGVASSASLLIQQAEEMFQQQPELLHTTCFHLPDYHKLVAMASFAGLFEMIEPAALIIVTPVICGIFCGVHALFGLLLGILISSLLLSISLFCSGGAFDSAKNLIISGHLYSREHEDEEEAAREEGGGGEVGGAAGEVGGGSPTWRHSSSSFGSEGGRASSPAATPPRSHARAMRKTERYTCCVLADCVGDPLADCVGPSLNVLAKLQCMIALIFVEVFVRINKGNGLLGLPLS